MDNKKEETKETKEISPTTLDDILNFSNLYDDDLISLFSNSPHYEEEILNFDEETNGKQNEAMKPETKKKIEENFHKLDETGQIEALNFIDMFDSTAINYDEVFKIYNLYF